MPTEITPEALKQLSEMLEQLDRGGGGDQAVEFLAVHPTS